MLGCKLWSGEICYNVGSELIDTCWDVNCINTLTGNHFQLELIDTCWDVNVYSEYASHALLMN